MKLEEAKRYLKAIKANKQRHLTCDVLAKDIGLYPDIIASALSFFDPVISIDMDYEVRDLIPELENFIKDKEGNKKSNKKVNKLANTKFKSVNDFVFNKYVVAGGLMDRSIELNEADLKELKKIINNEIKMKKKKR